jgi:hypothetical protein
MGLLSLFKRKADPVETRSVSATGFTSAIIAARESWISGQSGVAELSATTQACISLWEGALAAADVSGADMLSRHDMAIAARSLALRGESLFLIDGDRLTPCADWDLTTRGGRPRAYRATVAEAGGSFVETALADEVLHFRLASDAAAPWTGQSPLSRSRLTAGLLQAVEEALREVYQLGPIGSQVVPFPESPETDLAAIGRDFRGRRGRVLLRESVNVAAGGAAAPNTDWKPQSLTPDLEKAMTKASLDQARNAIAGAFGVLPALLSDSAQGPLVREAQRHLAGWTLQPLAMLMAEECGAKLGGPVSIDVMRPLQAFDVGGKARALSGYIEAIGKAKEAGLTPGEVADALRVVNWSDAQ